MYLARVTSYHTDDNTKTGGFQSDTNDIAAIALKLSGSAACFLSGQRRLSLFGTCLCGALVRAGERAWRRLATDCKRGCCFRPLASSVADRRHAIISTANGFTLPGRCTRFDERVFLSSDSSPAPGHGGRDRMRRANLAGGMRRANAA